MNAAPHTGRMVNPTFLEFTVGDCNCVLIREGNTTQKEEEEKATPPTKERETASSTKKEGAESNTAEQGKTAPPKKEGWECNTTQSSTAHKWRESKTPFSKMKHHHPREENNTTPNKNGNATPTKAAPPIREDGRKPHHQKMRRANHHFILMNLSSLYSNVVQFDLFIFVTLFLLSSQGEWQHHPKEAEESNTTQVEGGQGSTTHEGKTTPPCIWKFGGCVLHVWVHASFRHCVETFLPYSPMCLRVCVYNEKNSN